MKARVEIRKSTRQRGSRMRAGILTGGRQSQSTVANGDSHEVSGTGSRIVSRLPCDRAVHENVIPAQIGT